jgi:hypothetical protein
MLGKLQIRVNSCYRHKTLHNGDKLHLASVCLAAEVARLLSGGCPPYATGSPDSRRHLCCWVPASAGTSPEQAERALTADALGPRGATIP